VGDTDGPIVGLADGGVEGAVLGESVHTLSPHNSPSQLQQLNMSQCSFVEALLHSKQKLKASK
jgi:hypothetical protein